MRRREVLAAAVAAAVGCRRAPDRATVLEALGRQVVLPSYTRLYAAAARLEASCRALAVNEEALLDARSAWLEAVAALAFVAPLQLGPVADQRLHLRAAYWPVRPVAIEALGDGPLDPRALERAGVAVKGLFAIEYLLFDQRVVRLEKHRRTLAALAAEHARNSGSVEVIARERGLPHLLASQHGLALLVNALVEATETARGALEPALLDRPANGVVRVAGARGGAVQLLVAARLDGVRAHYQGLSTLVAALAPAADGAVHGALSSARGAVDALPAMPSGAEAARAVEQIRALDVALKTGVTAALGVVLTMQSADGD